MPLPFLAQLGIAAAPSIINGIGNLFRDDEPTKYERSLQSMADVYKEQTSSPLSENRFFKEGKRQLDKRDTKNREAIQNSSAVTGATNESRLASMENSNEVYSEGINRLFSTAQQYRDQMQQRYMNTMGRLNQAENRRDAQFQQKMNSIVKPLSTASSAFLMSDIYGGQGSGDTGSMAQDLLSSADKWMGTPKSGPTAGGNFNPWGGKALHDQNDYGKYGLGSSFA